MFAGTVATDPMVALALAPSNHKFTRCSSISVFTPPCARYVQPWTIAPGISSKVLELSNLHVEPWTDRTICFVLSVSITSCELTLELLNIVLMDALLAVLPNPIVDYPAL